MIKHYIVNRTAVITLNRPERRNALNHELVEALTESIQTAYDNIEVTNIIINAEGVAFCAGADLDYLQQLQKNSFDENVADSQQLRKLFELIYTGPKLIVAAIQGDAIAGGCGLASICDYSFSTSHARFGYTESKIGFIPALVMVFLMRKISGAHARTLLLTGSLISSEKAKEIGLINEVVDENLLLTQAIDFCNKMAIETSSNSIKTIKEMMAQIPGKTLAEALDYAAYKNAETRSHNDCKKGISAFLNKEKITW